MDLQLFSILQNDPKAAEAFDLTIRLRQLGRKPIRERAVFLHGVLCAVDHPFLPVRAAALHCLRGAEGRLAHQAILKSLGDPNPRIRRAALLALEATGGPSIKVCAIRHTSKLARKLVYGRWISREPLCLLSVHELAASISSLDWLPGHWRIEWPSTELLGVLADARSRERISTETMLALATELMVPPAWSNCVLDPSANPLSYVERHLSKRNLLRVMELAWTSESLNCRAFCDVFFRVMQTNFQGLPELQTIAGKHNGRWNRYAAGLFAALDPTFLIRSKHHKVPIAARRQALADSLRYALCLTNTMPGGTPDTPRGGGVTTRKRHKDLATARIIRDRLVFSCGKLVSLKLLASWNALFDLQEIEPQVRPENSGKDLTYYLERRPFEALLLAISVPPLSLDQISVLLPPAEISQLCGRVIAAYWHDSTLDEKVTTTIQMLPLPLWNHLAKCCELVDFPPERLEKLMSALLPALTLSSFLKAVESFPGSPGCTVRLQLLKSATRWIKEQLESGNVERSTHGAIHSLYWRLSRIPEVDALLHAMGSVRGCGTQVDNDLPWVAPDSVLRSILDQTAQAQSRPMAVLNDPHSNVSQLEEAVLALLTQGSAGAKRLAQRLFTPAKHATINAITSAISLFPLGRGLSLLRRMGKGRSTHPKLVIPLCRGFLERGEEWPRKRLTSLFVRKQSVPFVGPASLKWLLADGQLKLDPAQLFEACDDDARANLVEIWVNELGNAGNANGAIPTLPLIRKFVMSDVAGGKYLKLQRRALQLLKALRDPLAVPFILATAEEFEDATKIVAEIAGHDGEYLQDARSCLLGQIISRPNSAGWFEKLKPLRGNGQWVDQLRTGFNSGSPIPAMLSYFYFTRGDIAQPAAEWVELARLIPWGRDRARGLTGMKHEIKLSLDNKAAAWTSLTGTEIELCIRPVLARMSRAVPVMHGLVIHEAGHQLLHHSRVHGEEAVQLLKRAKRYGLDHHYNIVLDAHLERNLCSRDPQGELKTMNLCLSQYWLRSIPVEQILCLGLNAGDLLSNGPIFPSGASSVLLHRGKVLNAFAQAGSGYARFLRYLTTNQRPSPKQDTDPRVERALALFAGRGFARKSLKQLFDVASELQAIFAAEAVELPDITQMVFQLVEGHSAGDYAEEEENLGQAMQQMLVEAIRSTAIEQSRCNLEVLTSDINRKQDLSYPKIDLVTAPKPNWELLHTVLGDRNNLQGISRLRDGLREIGHRRSWIRGVAQGSRLSSRHVSRMLVGDPRVFRRTYSERANELFLGVAIDTSGSMSGPRLHLAKRFGVLILRASAGIPGVEARCIGFNGSEIFDCGNRPELVTGLPCDGNTNDCAALEFLAAKARSSGSMSVLLLEIADGEPTSCSVHALRHQVGVLTKEGFVCAQLAVADIEQSDRCFPDTIRIDDTHVPAAIDQFVKTARSRIIKALATETRPL